uniref:Neurotransmitter-gated ion-channel ligand-binding domain-containing protein n=1 Tax=Acrobeloides nanus TaxID=290746 RepID=A0A914DLR5_9BILA
PIRNQSLPIKIQIHVYIMHFSVDQMQQTILVNGHIYMVWNDEKLVWNSSEFSEVRTTIAKQWELWQPDLRVANSVSGVNQYFEISKRSHASLTSNGPDSTKIEVYPTFSMKIGCQFDYSNYPFDQQQCALRLYTTNRMNEVELQLYYNLNPSVLLGWGDDVTKKHIGEWELDSVTSNMTYYRNRNYYSERPSSGGEAEQSWSMVLTWISLKRNIGLFWVALALPSFISAILNVFSFFMPHPEHAIFLIVANFFMQSVFLQDILARLPPTVGSSPRIVQFSSLLLMLTSLALCLQLWIKRMGDTKQKISVEAARRMGMFLVVLAPMKKTQISETVEKESDDATKDVEELPDKALVVRNLCFVLYLLVVIFLSAFLLI